MVKFCARFFVVVLIFISFTTTSEAFFGRSIFGGKKITKLKASKVENLEKDGYDCDADEKGSTIEIDSIKGPTSYFIPNGVRPSSRNTTSINQKIIGITNEEETITCKKQDGDDTSVETFTLTKIKTFNVSAR